ncbi:MAG: hypothetical protein RI841_13925 [Halomonas sp.]|uniref:hypothetical protein n=1 Tax=Halomonas sp. TaxID=1486246 RepID=UPI00286FC0D8|nr:hypothetical protein [Halomonas sp.]MDR9440573.1 hypothetical protein [Halomonas sp.]
MERLPATAIPATLTAERLRRWLSPEQLPLVEIQSLDKGYDIVQRHHRDGITPLVAERGLHDPLTPAAWEKPLH